MFVPKNEIERILFSNASKEDRAASFASICRINTLYMITKAGSGHIGTSFSCMDILSWLYLNEIECSSGNQADNIYFSSKGHDAPALYSVLTALGKLEFDFIHQLRKLGGLPGHPDVATPHIVTNTGSLGMGVSKAKGMAFANRLSGTNKTIYVLTGDGELQEGQFWESLVSAANNNFHEITIIVDYNKIQSDTWVSEVCDHGDLNAKFTAFGWHVERCDGNDITEFSSALDRTKSVTDKPKVIIADTVKGSGVDFMEGPATPKGELYQFHSGAPSAEDYDRAIKQLSNRLLDQCEALGLGAVEISVRNRQENVAPRNTQKLIGAYANSLLELGGRHDKIVSLDADLVLDTGQIPFRNSYPDRFIECGIAEQDMVSQAGGLALNGYLPIVHSFACFLSTRPNEQIYNNATEDTKIIYTGSLAGILPGGPGHSHQSIRDIATLCGIPGLTLIEPSCEREVTATLKWAVEDNAHSTYIRLVSIPCENPFDLPEDYTMTEGVGVKVVDGKDVLLISYGPVMLTQAVLASNQLKARHNIDAGVVNLPWLNRIDRNWLKSAVNDVSQVFTIDDHYIEGGQGRFIAAELATLSLTDAPDVINLGVTEVPACGTNAEVLAHHKLDAESIVNTVLSRQK
jgi:transketolase